MKVCLCTLIKGQFHPCKCEVLHACGARPFSLFNCSQSGKRGELGPKGVSGPQGELGARGVPGKPGPMGFQGEQGLPGIAGKNGVPVSVGSSIHCDPFGNR